MNDVTIEGLDHMVETAKVNVKMAEALDRLKKNPDYKLIIEEGFLIKYAMSQVVEKAKYMNRSKEAQSFVDSQLMGVSVLTDYLTTIRVAGNTAHESIKSAETEKARYLRGDL